jgi:iron(III) transport system substrate-binding protein
MQRSLWLLAFLVVGAAAAVWWGFNAASGAGSVVVYVSHDQVFSEPILKDFEKETGIKVQAVYDTEETKSTGAMNRLIAEKNNPQADVYWANEPVRAEVLRQRQIAAPYRSPNSDGIPATFRDPQDYWTGFAARARVLIVRKDENPQPASVFSYTDPRWRDKAVIANPLFGTTTDQIAALFVHLGDERAQAFMQSMRENGTKLAPSNGDSADQVSRGQFAFSLVDSDDVVNRMTQGEPVTMVYPDQGPDEIGCFIVPNAAVLIAGSPHQEAGKKLIDYLLSSETERKLALSDAAQIPLHPGVAAPSQLKPIASIKVMKVDYAAIAAKLQAIQPFLKSWAGS